MVAGLSVMGVVIVVVAILATVFGVKYFTSKQGGQMEHTSDEPHYENQSCTAGETRGNERQDQSSQHENYPLDGRIHKTSNTGMLPEDPDV